MGSKDVWPERGATTPFKRLRQLLHSVLNDTSRIPVILHPDVTRYILHLVSRNIQIFVRRGYNSISGASRLDCPLIKH